MIKRLFKGAFALLLVLLALFGAYLGYFAFFDQPQPFPNGSVSATRLQPGPYSVGYFKDSFVDVARPTQAYRNYAGSDERTLPSSVWYPKESAAGASPILLFSHGFTSTRRNGRYMAEHLASHGFVVIAPDFPLTSVAAPDGALVDDVVNQPGDLSFLIDKMTELSGEAGHPLEAKVDGERVGVFGISLGGLTTQLVAFHPALRDPRIDAAVSIAGPTVNMTSAFFAGSSLPFLMLAGDVDALVPYATNALPVLEKNPSAELVTVHKGSHTGFSDGTRWIRGMHNTDAIGCWSVQRFVDPDADYSRLLGADEAGMDFSVKDELCKVDPLPATMHVLRQHRVALVVLRAFFERELAANAEVRARAARYLSEQMSGELADVSYARSAKR